jgi:hypothetical protein
MLKTVFLIIIIIYFALSLFAFFFADKMIFLPPSASYSDNANVIKIKTSANHLISAVYLFNKHAKYTILVSHGNAEDLGFIYPFLQELRAQGFSVFAYDYSGYGTSEGISSEKNSYDDIKSAYDYLVNDLGISSQNIILYGHSIGAAVSLDLATKSKVAGIIMESPFVTAFRVVTVFPILPFDEFDNLAKIQKVKCPLLIIHGEQDTIIPIWHGKELYAKANPIKKAYWVPDAGHNDIAYKAGESYWQTIKEFVNSI